MPSLLMIGRYINRLYAHVGEGIYGPLPATLQSRVLQYHKILIRTDRTYTRA